MIKCFIMAVHAPPLYNKHTFKAPRILPAFEFMYALTVISMHAVAHKYMHAHTHTYTFPCYV